SEMSGRRASGERRRRCSSADAGGGGTEGVYPFRSRHPQTGAPGVASSHISDEHEVRRDAAWPTREVTRAPGVRLGRSEAGRAGLRGGLLARGPVSDEPRRVVVAGSWGGLNAGRPSTMRCTAAWVVIEY